jgi:hypothetical protein
VEFEPNGTSATLKGMVQNRQEAEYLFAAKKGQKLSVQITSNPRDSVVPRITDPDSRGLQLRRGGSSTWTATLPKSGDYFMVILRTAKGPGRSTYTVALSLK